MKIVGLDLRCRKTGVVLEVGGVVVPSVERHGHVVLIPDDETTYLTNSQFESE